MTDNKLYAPPISTVIIPVGGYGTRMLPLTQAVPKPLLPVGEKPLISHTVDEALEAGVEHIVIACRPDEYDIYHKQFSVDDKTKQKIMRTGRPQLLEILGKCEKSYKDRVHVLPEFDERGPAATVKKVIEARNMDDEAFGVMLPDDLFVADKPVMGQLMRAFAQDPKTIVGTRKICNYTEHSNNGTFIQSHKKTPDFSNVKRIQIKPKQDEPISDRVSCGRYIFAAEFSTFVDDAYDHNIREISMSSVLLQMLDSGEEIGALKCKGTFYDCGNREKYQVAVARFLAIEVLHQAFTAATLEDQVPDHAEPEQPQQRVMNL